MIKNTRQMSLRHDTQTSGLDSKLTCNNRNEREAANLDTIYGS